MDSSGTSFTSRTVVLSQQCRIACDWLSWSGLVHCWYGSMGTSGMADMGLWVNHRFRYIHMNTICNIYIYRERGNTYIYEYIRYFHPGRGRSSWGLGPQKDEGLASTLAGICHPHWPGATLGVEPAGPKPVRDHSFGRGQGCPQVVADASASDAGAAAAAVLVG